MITVSTINYKGGVGKTTMTANLAAKLGKLGYHILLIDLDPQASLTFSFISVDDWKESYEKTKTINNWYDAFIDDDSDLDMANLIITPKKVNEYFSEGSIDLICSHLALINIDLELAVRLGGASPRQSRNNFLRVHSRLKEGLSSLDDDDYDFIIIDCPPNFNIVTKNALVASDYYLVPAKPDYLSTLGIEQLDLHVDELIKDYNNYASEANDSSWEEMDPVTLGVLFTMVYIKNNAPIDTQAQYVEQIKTTLGLPTFDTYIRENKTIFGDAPEYGVPVVLKNVSGTTYKNVKRELEEFTDEFLREI